MADKQSPYALYYALEAYGKSYWTPMRKGAWVLDLIAMGPYAEWVEPDVLEGLKLGISPGDGAPFDDYPGKVDRPIGLIRSIMESGPNRTDPMYAATMLLGAEYDTMTFREYIPKAFGMLFSYGTVSKELEESLRAKKRTEVAKNEAAAMLLSLGALSFLRVVLNHADEETWRYDIRDRSGVNAYGEWSWDYYSRLTALETVAALRAIVLEELGRYRLNALDKSIQDRVIVALLAAQQPEQRRW